MIPQQLLTKLPDGRPAIKIGFSGTNAMGIGDSVIFTALARELKQRWPDHEILMYTDGPRVVFENNPLINQVITGIIPCNIDKGEGHFITKKCRFFGIDNPLLKGEIYLTEQEIRWAKRTLELVSNDKPAIIMCQNSTGSDRNWTRDNWEAVVETLNPYYNIFQIEQKIHFARWGDGHPDNGMPFLYDTVRNARQDLRNFDLRRIMGLQSVAGKYLGPNTAFYHIARCFDNDSFTFMHRKHAGTNEWLYPESSTFSHFFEDENVNSVINRIKDRWIR